MTMSTEVPFETIATLIAEFKRSGIAELEYRHGDFEIYLSTKPGGRLASRRAVPSPGPVTGGVPVPPSPPPSALQGDDRLGDDGQVTAAPDLPEGACVVTAPNLGIFYRAPKPGAAPYVEVGATIAEGDELCLIEVMKLFTAVRAAKGGKVHSVIAEDGSMVEAGQPLFVLVDV